MIDLEPFIGKFKIIEQVMADGTIRTCLDYEYFARLLILCIIVVSFIYGIFRVTTLFK